MNKKLAQIVVNEMNKKANDEKDNIKVFKEYLKAHSNPRSSFEELSAWTNSWILKLLNQNNDDIEKVRQEIHQTYIDNGGNNMGSDAETAIKYFDIDYDNMLKKFNLK